MYPFGFYSRRKRDLSPHSTEFVMKILGRAKVYFELSFGNTGTIIGLSIESFTFTISDPHTILISAELLDHLLISEKP